MGFITILEKILFLKFLKRNSKIATDIAPIIKNNNVPSSPKAMYLLKI